MDIDRSKIYQNTQNAPSLPVFQFCGWIFPLISLIQFKYMTSFAGVAFAQIIAAWQQKKVLKRGMKLKISPSKMY